MLIVGAIAVAAIGVAAAFVVPQLLKPPSASDIVTAEFLERPTAGVWEIAHPLLDRARSGESLLTEVFTIGQDTAVAYWSAMHGSTDDIAMSALSLINTRTGEVFWTVDSSEIAGVVGWTDTLLVVSGPEGFAVYSRSTGELRAAASERSAGQLSFHGSNHVVDGVVLGVDASSIAGLRIENLSEVWSADAPGGLSGVAGRLAVVDEIAYDIATGASGIWAGEPVLHFFDLNGVLLGQTNDSFVALDASGNELWRAAPGEVVALPHAETIVFGYSSGSGVATARDVSTGEALWDHPYSNGSVYQGLGSGGRVLVPTTPSMVSGVDARTGVDLFTFEIENSFLRVIGSSTNVFYEFGGGNSSLWARSWANGDVLWVMDSPIYNWYGFDIAGGNLVGVIRYLDSNSMRSGGAAALIGIG